MHSGGTWQRAVARLGRARTAHAQRVLTTHAPDAACTSSAQRLLKRQQEFEASIRYGGRARGKLVRELGSTAGHGGVAGRQASKRPSTHTAAQSTAPTLAQPECTHAHARAGRTAAFSRSFLNSWSLLGGAWAPAPPRGSPCRLLPFIPCVSRPQPAGLAFVVRTESSAWATRHTCWPFALDPAVFCLCCLLPWAPNGAAAPGSRRCVWGRAALRLAVGGPRQAARQISQQI